MDECVGHGSILNAHLRTSRPLTYFTTGQRVPEDIEPATAERLVRLIFGTMEPLMTASDQAKTLRDLQQLASSRREEKGRQAKLLESLP